MIMMINLGIGLITPPVGSVLFVASAVGKQKIEQVVKAMLPFYCLLFVVLMMITYIPAISMAAAHDGRHVASATTAAMRASVVASPPLSDSDKTVSTPAG